MSAFEDPNYVNAFVEYRRLDPEIIEIWRSCVTKNILASRSRTKLLDIGCGTGRFSAVFAKTMDVTGLDSAEPMLSVAKGDLKNKDLKFTGVLSDIFDYQPDHLFDAALVSEMLHLASDLNSFFSKVFKLLAEKGTIHIRTATKDQISDRVFLRHFPSALQLEITRHHTLEHITECLISSGFTGVSSKSIDESITIDRSLWLRSISQRYHSALYSCSEQELREGLRELAIETSADPVTASFPMTYIVATV
jgi:cyclopropane fatty-acyl-phospholipid synthase-like methyltransferase